MSEGEGGGDFRYQPRDGGSIRAALWLADAGDEGPLREYAAGHAMEVAAVLLSEPAAEVLGRARQGAFNLVLVWRVTELSDHPLLSVLSALRAEGVELMSVLEL